ncbi:MAG: alpha/beta hydrolase [bacterium]|nr:alpha/beta hydrolase [bacterium]
MRSEIKVLTQRGILLDGVLFHVGIPSDTVLIAITGIHGNFFSNPFYYNIGDTLSSGGCDFIYAQTNDAFDQIPAYNYRTKEPELIGSFNERFQYTDEDIAAYLDYAEKRGYKHIYLAGHSLGANKVIYYLSRHHDIRVEKFLLLSPADLEHMMSSVTAQEKEYIRQQVENGRGEKMLPFYFMGWVACQANTAYDWALTDMLNNVHPEADRDFTQVENITHTGALLIGTLDTFTKGDPAGFLRNINAHMPNAEQNELIFLEGTGHTYQQKHQEVADKINALIQRWRLQQRSQDQKSDQLPRCS